MNLLVIGVSISLDDDVKKHRRDNITKFYNYISDYGGYSELDSPAVVGDCQYSSKV